MFERFTEKAIKVIMLAQEEARRLGHNFVGTEQILLGLIGEGSGSICGPAAPRCGPWCTARPQRSGPASGAWPMR